MRFCTVTLGCKVNQFETSAIGSILDLRGGTQVKPGEGADVCIVNTCAVTAESERKSRQIVRRVRKLEPDARIAVCGCLSQMAPSEIERLGVDFIGGTGDRNGFVSMIEDCSNGRPLTLIDDPTERRLFEESSPDFRSHPDTARRMTRSLLKIQDGCDNYCAYCIVPYLRGPVRSLPVDRAADQTRRLRESGFREIIVTGIEISSYGRDLDGGYALIDVVREICLAAQNTRVRLGSLDPGALKEELCRDLSLIPNLCPHFHLSLQSGCDDTLRRMGRKYGAKNVREAMASLRHFFPDCGITADLITGFPGETDDEFIQTLEFIKSARFSDMHIFPFSPRPGTRAADMPDQIEKSVRRKRAGIAAVAAAEMAQEYKLSRVGKVVEV